MTNLISLKISLEVLKTYFFFFISSGSIRAFGRSVQNGVASESLDSPVLNRKHRRFGLAFPKAPGLQLRSRVESHEPHHPLSLKPLPFLGCLDETARQQQPQGQRV